jgi:nitroreductase
LHPACGRYSLDGRALAAESLMMLAARGIGLGTCWIGFTQSWLWTPESKAFVKLPTNHKPVAPNIVGHPKAAPPPVPRNEPDIRWIGA